MPVPRCKRLRQGFFRFLPISQCSRYWTRPAEIETSCEQGICGSCITRVLEGTPDHRDQFMTDAEHACNDQFTPCCSRAKTPCLVLDL